METGAVVEADGERRRRSSDSRSGSRAGGPVDRRRMAVRAAGLDECLAWVEQNTGDSIDSTQRQASRLLGRWIQAYARGDRAAYQRRLSWDGWTEAQADLALSLTEGEPKPDSLSQAPWLRTLGQVAESFPDWLAELKSGETDDLLIFGSGQTVPFLPLWIPFLRQGRRQLCRDLVQQAAWRRSAIRDLERRLLRDLSAIGVQVLYETFSRHRDSAAPVRSGARPQTGPAAEESRYGTFIEHMLSGGLLELFHTYSTLARRLCEAVDQWSESTTELLERWLSDRDLLASRLTIEGTVESLTLGLSDRHHRGRQAAQIHLSNGSSVIYKPRSMATEAAFEMLLKQLETQGLKPCPVPVQVVDRGTHGWCEVIHQAQSFDDTQAARYFQQAGALLCLAYVLRIDDLHEENIMASDQGPRLIDLETMLQPRRAGESSWSVLSSQLLSSPQVDARGRTYDCGGFLGRGGHVQQTARKYWKNVNSDAMTFELRDAEAPPQANVVRRQDGQLVSPADHLPDLERGFAAAYRLLAVPGEPQARFQPAELFAHCRIRVLLRPTQRYGQILALLSSPTYLRTGCAAGILVDSLNRIFLGRDQKPSVWPLTRVERQALERRDIPYFSLPVSSMEFTIDGQRVRGELELDGLAATRRQLAAMNEADLERQLESIRRVCSAAGPAARSPRAPWPSRARTLGEIFLRRAERSKRENAWLLPDGYNGAVSPTLYDGAAGIAVFLAALFHRTGDRQFEELSRHAWQQACDVDAGPRAGFCSGLGGKLYAACALAHFLGQDAEPWISPLMPAPQLGERGGESTLSTAAGELGKGSKVDRPTTEWDVADGDAGLVAALLVAAAAQGISDPLRARIEERLARVAGRWLGRLSSWAPEDSQLGFAHGISGAALVLWRLGGFLGERPLEERALALLQLEKKLFEQRGAGLITEPIGWCGGVPGMALARLELGVEERGALLAPDLDFALGHTARAPAGSADDLCCGLAGRADVLLEAGRLAGRRDLSDRAVDIAAGLPSTAADFQTAFNGGLFTGIAGLGYLMLRMERPAEVPSILHLRL